MQYPLSNSTICDIIELVPRRARVPVIILGQIGFLVCALLALTKILLKVLFINSEVLLDLQYTDMSTSRRKIRKKTRISITTSTVRVPV